MGQHLIWVMTFVRVVELKSFALAAKALKLTPSAVSRQIKALEASLGVQLLQRTTRAMSLTEAGSAYFQQCQSGLAQIDIAGEQIQQTQKTPRGTLKVSVPVYFGQQFVMPYMADFLSQYPEVDVEFVLTDRYVDVVAEGVSLAIRIGRMPDSSLICRKLLDNRRVLVASPKYVQAHGPIHSIDDLLRLNNLVLTVNRDGEIWRLFAQDGERSIKPTSRFRANHGEAIARMAIDGAGIAFLSRINVMPFLRDGRLIQVLPEWHGRESGVFAVFPPIRPLLPLTELFVKYLQRCWESAPLVTLPK